eukprot:3555881-Amphidinium_carterae.4
MKHVNSMAPHPGGKPQVADCPSARPTVHVESNVESLHWVAILQSKGFKSATQLSFVALATIHKNTSLVLSAAVLQCCAPQSCKQDQRFHQEFPVQHGPRLCLCKLAAKQARQIYKPQTIL